MSKKKFALGLSVVAMLCVSAFSAASASALTISLEKCEKAAGTATEYTSATCTTTGAGGFHKVAFTTITPEVEVANASASTLASINGGVKFTIKCTGLTGKGSAQDTGEQVAGTGIVLTYSGCTVTEPAGKACVVRGKGDAVGSGKITTNSLKSTTTRTATGPDKYKSVYSPTSGTEFVNIVVESCSVIALNGEKPVTGTATSVGGEDGMKQEFSSTSGSELKFGGQAATLTSSNEQKMGETFVNVGP